MRDFPFLETNGNDSKVLNRTTAAGNRTVLDSELERENKKEPTTPEENRVETQRLPPSHLSKLPERVHWAEVLEGVGKRDRTRSTGPLEGIYTIVVRPRLSLSGKLND